MGPVRGAVTLATAVASDEVPLSLPGLAASRTLVWAAVTAAEAARASASILSDSASPYMWRGLYRLWITTAAAPSSPSSPSSAASASSPSSSSASSSAGCCLGSTAPETAFIAASTPAIM